MTLSEERELAQAVKVQAGRLLVADSYSERHLARLELGKAMRELIERAEASANPHFRPLVRS